MKRMMIRKEGVYGLTSSVCASDTCYQSYVHSSGSIPIEEFKSISEPNVESGISAERMAKLEYAVEKHKDALRKLSL